MSFCEALALPLGGRLSLVGGGGKSTLMACLAGELGATCRVVAMTTTRMTRPQGEAAGWLLLSGGADRLRAALAVHPAVCAATLCEDGKLGPPAPELLETDAADWLLAEADGARMLPMKAPAAHEPVLLAGGLVVAVAGVSALGRPLFEACHRPELAARVLGVSQEEPVTPELLGRLLTSREGQYKGVTEVGRFRVLLNQADVNPVGAAETAREVLRLLPGCRVVTASLRERNGIREVLF